MSRGPILTVGGIADYLEVNQKAMRWAEDAVCLILYRSELAMLLAAMRCWEAERKHLTTQAAAAPTPATEPEDQEWQDWPADRMTEEELLAGLEEVCGPHPSAEVSVQPRAPKHYGEGPQGQGGAAGYPSPAPSPSASWSATTAGSSQVCVPKFGLDD